MFCKSITPLGIVKQHRSIEFRLYPNKEQVEIIFRYLNVCRWIYNQALEQRKKAYDRRGESIDLLDQQKMLTVWRSRIDRLKDVPAQFERDALRRVQKAFDGFFRRVKDKSKSPGFPRFKGSDRYHSMEQLEPGKYVRPGRIYVPGIGPIKARGKLRIQGPQKSLKIIHKAGKFFAQILVEECLPIPTAKPQEPSVGIDLGLTTYATLHTGEEIGNPRIFKKHQSELRSKNKQLARRRKGSNRRKKAKHELGQLHDTIQRQRRGFLHRISRDLVNRFNTIYVEDLNVKGLAKGRLAKSIHDVAWSTFVGHLVYKAASAGKRVLFVDARRTSQECPQCGNVVPKKLSERVHDCSRCHLTLNRDHAAAIVVRNRGVSPCRGGVVSPSASPKATPVKRRGSVSLVK